MTQSKKIQNAILSLLKTEPFYAHFLMECKIVHDFKDPRGNAAIAIINGTPTLFFNNEWVEKLPDDEAEGVLKHEILHLLLEHVVPDNRGTRDPMLANLAEDCVINQYIKALPEGCVTLDWASKVCGETLLPEQTSDYYYDKFMKKAKQMQGSGMKTVDVHGVEMLGQDSPEVAKGVIKRVGQNAINRSAGNTPEFITKAIAALGDAKLPWKVLLRNAIMSQVSRKTQSTTKKINRRFDLPVPGKKKKREMTLGVCVDESGSVSEEQWTSFMNEIQSIAKQVNKVYLVHADCAVAAVEDLSKAKFKAERRAAGGTAYQPAITKCQELKCNMIVYFGDFDTADKPKNPGVPFLWVGVGNSPAPAEFGKVIRL